MVGDMLLVAGSHETFSAVPSVRNLPYAWIAMASFMRTFGEFVEDVAIGLFRQTSDDWILKNSHNIAIIHLKIRNSAFNLTHSHRALGTSDYHVSDLQQALNMERFGCDMTYYRLVVDEYSIAVPMINVGLVINGAGVDGESMVYHVTRVVRQPPNGAWKSLDSAWTGLVNAVEVSHNE